jgi:hypothetical protein
MAKGFKTGGRQRGFAISPAVCDGLVTRPRTAEQWLSNSRLISALYSEGITYKAIADAVGLSDSMIALWGKAGRRWPEAVRLAILREPDKFAPELLTRLANRLWTDVDHHLGSRRDRRRNGRPTQSLQAAVDLILADKPIRRERRSLADRADNLSKVANRERSRAHRLKQELEGAKEENQALQRQVSLHSIDEARRTIKSLQDQLALAKAGKLVFEKTYPKNADDEYVENCFRSRLGVRTSYYPDLGKVVISVGDRDILEGILDRLSYLK